MPEYTQPTAEHDPFAYLEELNDETFAWAQERSNESLRIFAGKRFERHLHETDAIMSAKDKLVAGTRRGDYVYDFYADGQYPRGLWRRTRKKTTTPTRTRAPSPPGKPW